MTVTHENFDAAVETVKAGGRFLVLTMRPVIVTAKTWDSWAADGKRVIYPAKTEKGFYIRRGRRADYILPGLLVVEA